MIAESERPAARAAFVAQTHVDRVCPELELRLTEPGGYDDLLRRTGGEQNTKSFHRLSPSVSMGA